MREHEIIIRLKLPRWSRTRWIFTGAAAALIIGSVAYAAVPNTFSAGDPLSSSKLNGNFSALDARIAALEAAVAIPPGTIAPYAGSVVPSGWLLCDGAEVSRTQYAALFAAITIAHGGGNGVTTFNLPDYRGRFLRGTDNGAGRDPDRTTRGAANSGGNSGDSVGSIQGDDFKSHNHNLLTHDGSGAISGMVPLGWNPGSGGSASAYTEMSTATGGGPGNESRPKNANVNFIIKT